ncbi:hypothetical protein CONCODRAFT_4702 [Conidiobolus coronatus NRRL 28638]|uniref:CAAX prenyl protease 1 N-terminal domain-containing protein n=1 Tax=Conidiobolus coronatus (strain ATCC 28846 / CBS 209.66 / NRRL 28638) TaxID=796925 RepID=A0A137PBT4_CONC2|nr:hypothetical protein CONCODRAFT_4702 [Conidiobolus coronatus NRRL 28638]|eukprot:KXN72477.1 hypothetical protein CONCODRAFT_4702 [Conidiobolus coronatus NRRL 28638]
MIIHLLEYKSTATKIYFGVYALETYLNARQHRKLLETKVPEALEGVVSEEKFEKERLFELRESRYRFVKGAWKVVKNIIFIQYDIYPQIWKYSSELLVQYFNLSGTHWYTDYFIVTAIFPIADAISDSSTDIKPLRRIPQVNIDLSLSLALDILPQLYFINQGISDSYMYIMPFRFVRSAIGALLREPIIQYYLKTEPFQNDKVYKDIIELADNFGFYVDDILIYHKNTNEPGAPDIYIFENFISKTIYLSNTIADNVSEQEIYALVMRELSIEKSHYGLKKYILNLACSLALIYDFSKAMQNHRFYQQFGINTMPIIFGATMFKILIAPFKPITNFFFNLIARNMEIKANYFVKSQDYGKRLRSGLIVSFANNMKSFNNDPLYSIYRSHKMSLAENLKSIGKTT